MEEAKSIINKSFLFVVMTSSWI